MSSPLSTGCLKPATDGATLPELRLQVLKIKPMAERTQGAAPRITLTVSDGVHHTQAIMSTQPDDLQTKISVGCVVVATRFVVTHPVKDHKVLILVKLSAVLPSQPTIGNPVALNSKGDVKPAAASGGYGARAAPAAAPYGAAAPAYGGAVARRPAQSMPSVPIDSLNPYSSTFTIKCRVTSKSDIRTWSNDRSSGKVFSIDLLDEYGGEIQGAFFNKQVDDFFDMIQEGKVYYFSGGRVKIANKRFTSIKNDHSLSFDRNTRIVAAAEDTAIRRLNYSFTTIDQIERMNKNDRVDLCAILRNPRETQSLTTRAGKETVKRDVELVDQSGSSITLTLWGEKTELPDEAMHSGVIVAIKGAVVGDYNGKTLGTWRSTRVDFNPPIPEAEKLHAWMSANPDAVASATSLSRSGGGASSSVAKRKPLSAIVDENLGQEAGGDYLSVKAAVLFLKPGQRNWYPACPRTRNERTCNKRVNQNGSGTWECEACQTTIPKPEYRYVLSCNIADHSGSSWVTLFDEAGKAVVGCPAGDLAQLFVEGSEEDANAAVERKFKEAQYKTYHMRCRVKMEEYNDTQRLKVSAVGVKKVDFASESRALIAGINAFA